MNYNYFILFAVIAGILYYNSATKMEGFSLPGVSLPTSVRPFVRRARLFREDSVRRIETMSTQWKAKAMMETK